MRRDIFLVPFLFALLITSIFFPALIHAAKSSPDTNYNILSKESQKVKLAAIELNKKAVRYVSKSDSSAAYVYQARNRADYTFDLVLKDFEQKFYLQAINRYHIGRELGTIKSKYSYALRVANIYLDYGLYSYSKQLFDALVGNEDSAVASTARYYLAKHHYVNKNFVEALKGFESVVDGLPGDLLDQNRLYQGIIYQRQKNHKKAIERFSQVEQESDRYIYAQFNIAISNLRKGWWADAENAIINIVNVSQSTDKSELTDRLNVALGYSQLQRRYFREAFQSLDKVNKDGVFAYKALLGMGLVAAEQGKYSEALDIMDQLRESYSGLLVTEEAHLVVPFLLESIGNEEKTLKYYQRAAKYYSKAIHTIRNLKEEVLLGKFDHEFVIPHQNKNTAQIVEKPKPGEINRYLFELLEDGRWQRATQELSDIKELTVLTKKWQDTLSVVGGYDRKTYNRLKKNAEKILTTLRKLKARYLSYIRLRINEHLDIRRDYFHSYMSQSKFGLARLYDSALGVNIGVNVGGIEIDETLVRKTYREYLKAANKKSVNRRLALIRLAELELDYREKLLAEESTSKIIENKAAQRLDKSIDLLNLALKDYPDHEENDRLWYQLIKAYDKKGQQDNVLTAMRELVDNYSHSPFFTEIQFKLGEEYLTGNDSIDAELAYSAALRRGDDGSEFYRRALYKRGWSRLRQSLYEDALEDFFSVIELADYGSHRKMTTAEKTIYDDIMRGVTLCFVNQDGLATLNSYYAKNHDAPNSDMVYEAVGESFLQQKRLQDAVDVYQSYVNRYSMSPRAPEFVVKIINVWKNNGYQKQEIAARNVLEEKYGLDGRFWQKNDVKDYANIREALKSNSKYMTSYYHSRYQRKKANENLASAKHWYDRYLKVFGEDKDTTKIHFLYAELLSDAGELDVALKHYNIASATNDKKVKNAEAAYARIVTTETLIKSNKGNKEKLIAQKIEYSSDFARDFPGDSRVPITVLNAMEEEFSRKKYKETLALFKLFPSNAPLRLTEKSQLLKAHSLFGMNNYSQAEQVYSKLLGSQKLKRQEKAKLKNQLASAIYKQGEIAARQGNESDAITHYLRIKTVTPRSTVVPVAQYDAANLLIKQKQYDRAIPILETWRDKYPKHKLYDQATKKLAVLYMESQDEKKSAQAFEYIAANNAGGEERKQALWQSAELYEKLKENKKAIKLFSQYVNENPEPFVEMIEAKARLVELYGKNKDTKSQNFWRKKIIDWDKQNRKRSTDRTKYLAANAALGLAKVDFQYFKSINIAPPLKKSLLRKKNAMQRAIDSLSGVSGYAIEESSTEATYYIAQVYNSFSKALLNSPRPAGLAGMELEQYDVLLEEQAFPFEEKAIEIHKGNTQLVKQGIYNQWIDFSFSQLAKLLPSTYNKPDKLEPFIDPLPDKVSAATSGDL